MLSDLEYHVYHLQRPRHPSDESSTTGMSSTSSPSPTVPPPSQPSTSSFTSATRNGVGYSTLTTAIPVTTITQGGTTSTSFSQFISIQTLSTYSQSTASTSVSAAFATSSIGASPLSTCLGKGIDAAAAGIIASIILPTAIGLVLWVSAPPRIHFDQVQDGVSVAHFCNCTAAFSTNIRFTRVVCSPRVSFNPSFPHVVNVFLPVFVRDLLVQGFLLSYSQRFPLFLLCLKMYQMQVEAPQSTLNSFPRMSNLANAPSGWHL